MQAAGSPYGHMALVGSAEGAAAYMELIRRSNEAVELSKTSQNLEQAEAIFRDVLARKPAAGFDASSIAITQNELGRVLRKLGKLDEALELIQKAFEMREAFDVKAGITTATRDGNYSRDELAKVYEAMGDCAKALETREPGKRICSNEGCNVLEYKELLGCSRCKCVFYCSRHCQKKDWKARHKPLCQPIARPPPP